jgi:hypothetical protein
MEIIDKLVNLVIRLYGETEGYLDDQSDAQLWYNRGYANGMAAALKAAGHGEALASRLSLDAEGLYSEDHFMAWTKAYHHGFEMGEQETREALTGNVAGV